MKKNYKMLTKEQLIKIYKDIALVSRIVSGHKNTPKHFIVIFKEILNFIKDPTNEDLIISMPPGTGKSFILSNIIPLYLCSLKSNYDVLICSYNSTIAFKQFKKLRLLFESENYKLIFPHIKILEINNSIIRLSNGSTITSTGIDGTITGNRFNLVLVDDPHKSLRDTQGAVLQTVIENYNTAIKTRKKPASELKVITLLTRWSTDDLAGHLIGTNYSGECGIYNNIKVINIPAFAISNNDILGRKIKESLEFDQFNEKYYTERRNRISESQFNSLYQGLPFIQSGNEIKREWIKFDFVINKNQYQYNDFYISCDFALTDNIDSDYTVFVVWTMDKSRNIMMVADIHYLRATTNIWMDKLDIFLSRFNPKILFVPNDNIYKSLQNDFINLVNKHYCQIYVMPDHRRKREKAGALMLQLEKGNIIFNNEISLPEQKEIIDQLTMFPNGRHEDIVDALSHFPRYIENLIDSHKKPIINRLDTISRQIQYGGQI